MYTHTYILYIYIYIYIYTHEYLDAWHHRTIRPGSSSSERIGHERPQGVRVAQLEASTGRFQGLGNHLGSEH